MKEDPKVVAITSGTPMVLGFSSKRRNEAGKQFVDVGIAEEHAAALASGIAANGGKPVYGVYSTFLQRTYDQLSQDLCINNNPAVILVNLASVYGMNESLKEDHELVITLEDGILEGGFGEKIASFYGPSDMKVKNYGIRKGFPDRYVPDELLRVNGISVEQIVKDIRTIMDKC